MMTIREMAEAYVKSVEQHANALITQGLQNQQHAKECRAELEKPDQPPAEPKPQKRTRKR